MHLIPHNKLRLTIADRAAVARVLDSGHIAQGPEVAALEEELAAYLGRPAACVSSGTLATYLALRVLGLEELTAPTYTCVSLLHAAELAGVRIKLVDIDPQHFNADSQMAVHTYGVPYVPEGVVLEDLSHAFGARWRGRLVGTFGRAAVMSLHATKALPAGVGGVVFGDDALVREVKDRRDYDGKAVLRPRINAQMSDLHAAIGRSQLARYGTTLALRAEIARRYDASEPTGVQMVPEGAQAVRYRYVLTTAQPQRTIERLREYGVEAIVPMYPWECLHRQREEPTSRYSAAEWTALTTVSVPIHPGLTGAQVALVCAALDALRPQDVEGVPA